MKKLALVVLIFVAASMLVLAQGRRVTITFSPEEKTPMSREERLAKFADVVRVNRN